LSLQAFADNAISNGTIARYCYADRHMMREAPETLKSGVGNWSAEAISFVEAISWASPYDFSDVSFAIYASNTC
jgi:hypothetical protein